MPRPYLNIVLRNPVTGAALKTYGLIDTGADECAFPAWMGKSLGHNLEAGLPKIVTTASGHATTYAHSTIIEIPGFCTETVMVDYSPSLGICLLGVNRFLSNFILVVNYSKQYFSLRSGRRVMGQMALRLR